MEACSRNRCCAILSLSIRRCSPSLYLLLTYSLITRSRFGSACFFSSCAHLTTLARSFTQWLFDWFLGLIVVSLCDFTLYIPISNFLVHTFSSFCSFVRVSFSPFHSSHFYDSFGNSHPNADQFERTAC